MKHNQGSRARSPRNGFWFVACILISFFVGNTLNIVFLDVLVCTFNPPQASIKILEPVTLAEVQWHPSGYPVKGIHTGLECNENLNLYLLINPVKTDYWWVQNPIQIFPDGTWEAYAYFGIKTQEETEEYRILTLVASKGTFERGIAISRLELNEIGPFTNHSILVRRQGMDMELTVLYPQDDLEVIWSTPVCGRASGLHARPDLHLYLLVFPEESNGPWYVQDLPYISDTGEWVGITYIGRDPKDTTEDSGKKFKLAIMITDQELKPGETLDILPEDAACIQILNLTRK